MMQSASARLKGEVEIAVMEDSVAELSISVAVIGVFALPETWIVADIELTSHTASASPKSRSNLVK
jgi:hypothetical protein